MTNGQDEEPPTLESENQQLTRQLGSDNPPMGVADAQDFPPPTVKEVLDRVGAMLEKMQAALSELMARLEDWVDAVELSGELSVGETLDAGGFAEAYLKGQQCGKCKWAGHVSGCPDEADCGLPCCAFIAKAEGEQ